MSFSRIAAIILALSTCSAAAADHVRCPMRMMTEDGTVHTLSNARVFRGPESKQVEIAPVHGNFDLGSSQGTGSDPFDLVCAYNRTDETRTIEVPRSATHCDVADAGSGTVAGCH